MSIGCTDFPIIYCPDGTHASLDCSGGIWHVPEIVPFGVEKEHSPPVETLAQALMAAAGGVGMLLVCIFMPPIPLIPDMLPLIFPFAPLALEL